LITELIAQTYTQYGKKTYSSNSEITESIKKAWDCRRCEAKKHSICILTVASTVQSSSSSPSSTNISSSNK
jgi:hypothetical protein